MVYKPQTFHGEPPVVELEHETLPELERRVADLLAISEGIDASDVTVTEVDGDIVLAGVLTRPEEIDRAVDIARSVPGVANIHLKLRVSGPLGRR